MRTVRDQGLHSVRPYDDLDFPLNLQCLSESASGARDRPPFTHTLARVYAVIVTLSARDSNDVSAKNIRALIIFPPLTSAFRQEALNKY